MKAKNAYIIPVAKEMLQRIDRSSSPAHIGKLRNSVDFIAPKGTCSCCSRWYSNFHQ